MPTYLLVEPLPPVVVIEFVLEDGVYRSSAEHRGNAPLQLGITLDLDALG